WRHLRGDQQHHLDQSRFFLRQRFPQSRTHATGHRTGRPRYSDAARSDSELQCAQWPRSTCSDIVVRERALVGWPIADRWVQLLSLRAILWLRQARLHQRRGDPRDGTASCAVAAWIRLRVGRAIAAGKALWIAGAAVADAVCSAGVPGPSCAL